MVEEQGSLYSKVFKSDPKCYSNEDNASQSSLNENGNVKEKFAPPAHQFSPRSPT